MTGLRASASGALCALAILAGIGCSSSGSSDDAGGERVRPGTDYPGFSPGVVPSGCTARALTAQEKVIEYAIFDLTSCLTPIGQAPLPPRVP
jgi:hypothetical protein